MDRLNSTAVATLKRDHSGSISKLIVIRHVNEYPTMHYFGNPKHTQSMIAYKTLTEYIWEHSVKIL